MVFVLPAVTLQQTGLNAMAGKKLTPEELAAKIDWIKSALKKNPKLTRSHFQSNCGYSLTFINKLVEQGEIAFEPSKHRNSKNSCVIQAKSV